jgi:ubiquinone/menaquinone biosynthesis C-methylase UbiE
MTHQPAPAPPADYLPAMGRRWMLPLYDPFSRLMGARRPRGELLDRAGLRPGARVLEIGCGTGTVLLAATRRCPGVEATGLDPDPAALRRARRKATRAGQALRLDQGFAADLPYPDGGFDRVLSSFMLHHLRPADLPTALAEVRRVLAPGGELHVVDVAGAHHAHGPLRWLSRRGPRVQHTPPDRVLALLGEAGFTGVAVTGQGHTRVGDYVLLRAAR